jgi:hypothetical protein
VPAAQRLAALLVVAAVALVVATQATASAAGTQQDLRVGEAALGATESAAKTSRARTTARIAGCNNRRGWGCDPRSRIVRTNRGFSCTRPLDRIARAHGRGLPLLVKIKFTRYVNINPGVIELRHGCRGDGNRNTIDLILKVNGNGRTTGGTVDAIKVREDPHDIQITGYANCGPQGVGPDGQPDTADDSHQDGAQIQGGNRIEFIDFRWGKWKKRKATCQGAAGTFVPGSVNGWPVRNMACIRCKSVSCNHGMFISTSVGNVVRNSKWRSGRPADTRGILANGQTGLCNHQASPCVIIGWETSGNHISGQMCDRWPYRRRG